MKVIMKTVCICVLLAGISCKKDGAMDPQNIVTVDLPEKIEFSPSAQLSTKNPLPSKGSAETVKIPQSVSLQNSKKTLPLLVAPTKPNLDSRIIEPVFFRDPFLSYLDFASEEEMLQNKQAALLDFDIQNYRYVGFLNQGNRPMALVEDPAGIGYMLKVGSLIGRNKGRIISIDSNRIVIAEEDRGVAGKLKKSETVLKLAP